jgi:tetratricopeptide (TPR) repeat protein
MTRRESPNRLLAPARSTTAVVAVLALVVLAGVAVYGVVTVARSTPVTANGATGVSSSGQPAGPTTNLVLEQVQPLITSGEWSKAAALLLPAIEAHPEEQDLRLALARTYSGQRDWAKSYPAYEAPAYEAALTIGPESAALQAEAGTVANAAGLIDRSIEHYSRAQQLDPKDPRHPLYLGMVQVKAGKDSEAMLSLLTATVLNPELAPAWGVMGELELRANHLDLALQHLEKARKIEPESLKWRLAEAKVHKRQNEPAKTLDLLVNLPEKQRYNADVIPVVADALAMLKQSERRTEYGKAAAEYAKREQDQKGLDQALLITGGK